MISIARLSLQFGQCESMALTYSTVTYVLLTYCPKVYVNQKFICKLMSFIKSQNITKPKIQAKVIFGHWAAHQQHYRLYKTNRSFKCFVCIYVSK